MLNSEAMLKQSEEEYLQTCALGVMHHIDMARKVNKKLTKLEDKPVTEESHSVLGK